MLFHDLKAVDALAATLRERFGGGVDGAAILGSGFGSLRELVEDPHCIAYSEIEGLAECGSPGHDSEIVLGRIGGRRYALFCGRLHVYEGIPAAKACLPVALASALGARRLMLTCAAGATTETLEPGTLVLIEDHINLTGHNPLLAVPVRERRPPFLSMADAYARDGLTLAETLAGRVPFPLRRVVLAALPGPSFETPAEYRALARLGADVVSMSCVLETIAARSLGVAVLGLAVVANGPAHLGERGATAEDVLAVADRTVRARSRFFEALMSGFAAPL